MNLSLSKMFKPPLYEKGLLDELQHNIVHGETQEEQIYSLRIVFNLCYNSEIKMRNYEKMLPHILSVMKQKNPDVVLQCLLLLKKMTEGERTFSEQDLRCLPSLLECAKAEDKRVHEAAVKNLMILCENNPKDFLSEFDEQGHGIQMCIHFYT